MDIYELKRQWKKAQYKNELICEDCGTPVELRAGDVKIPYFAHRKGFSTRDCYYETTRETEEHREAKGILYEYFVAKYPGAIVQTTKRQPNGRRSDIYIDFGSSELAIEFQRTYMKISDWDERHLEYEKLGITDLWILSSRMLEDRRNDVDFLTQVLLHETKEETVIFFDVDKRKLSLLKEIQYLDNQGILKHKTFFIRDYNLFDVTISSEGQILCDFSEQYCVAKDRFIEECHATEIADQLKRDELERLRLVSEAKAKEERERLWSERQNAIRTQSTSTLTQRPGQQILKSSSEHESEIAKAERELEAILASITNKNLEYRDHEVISKWIDQLQSIKEISGKIECDVSYSQLMLDCERIIMGYRNNKYIAVQNTKRLELKLKILEKLTIEMT